MKPDDLICVRPALEDDGVAAISGKHPEDPEPNIYTVKSRAHALGLAIDLIHYALADEQRERNGF